MIKKNEHGQWVVSGTKYKWARKEQAEKFQAYLKSKKRRFFK